MDDIPGQSRDERWLIDSRHKTHIIILTLISMIVGLYFVSTLVLIAHDGVVYIDIARQMDDGSYPPASGRVQAPGYSFLIYLTHKAVSLFANTRSLDGWILSGQLVSLLSKTAALVIVYYIGCYFVGAGFSFWGNLILSLLPDSVCLGCDVLSDWTHILFLAAGFLLLLLGVESRRHILFCCAGMVTGCGYLVRPECSQVMIYGGLWLLVEFIRPRRNIKRIEPVIASFLFVLGFGLVAFPYIKSSGYLFPEHLMFKLPLSRLQGDSVLWPGMQMASFPFGKTVGGETTLVNLCEILVYYFFPAMVIGVYYYFRYWHKSKQQVFFAVLFILVNLILVGWLSSYMKVLSRRYVLPLTALTVFYIPVGISYIARRLKRVSAGGDTSEPRRMEFHFYLLIAIGLGICAAKLMRAAPLRRDKQGYLQAVEWLSVNTSAEDKIAVSDMRIAFYAQRQGIRYDGKTIPRQAGYAVRAIRAKEPKVSPGPGWKEQYSVPVNQQADSATLVIYQKNSEKP
jgi:hypothetical protein